MTMLMQLGILEKRIAELEKAAKAVCIEYHVASTQELLEGLPESFIVSIIELGKLVDEDL